MANTAFLSHNEKTFKEDLAAGRNEVAKAKLLVLVGFAAGSPLNAEKWVVLVRLQSLVTGASDSAQLRQLYEQLQPFLVLAAR